MTGDYGKRVALAIAAVRTLYSNSNRLLVDCDKAIGEGAESFFGRTATRDVFLTLNGESWMSEGFYRYYRDPTDSQTFRCLTACFFDQKEPLRPGASELLPEPLLLVGRITYAADGAPEGWDLWNAWFKWGATREPGEIVSRLPATSSAPPRVHRAVLIGSPLCGIGAVQDVEAMMQKIVAQPTP